MSEPETLPRHVHPEVALLPWYVNGTLADVERNQIARHLETCEDCRVELEEISNLKAGLTAIYDAQPGSSAQTARAVLAAVAAEVRAGRSRPSSQGSWLESIDQWFRSLFTAQWVPTLAAMLFVAQIGLLLWISMPPEDGQITTRSLGMQTVKLAVAFQPSSSEEQIRALLQSLQGRVVDGPAQDGTYIIEVTAADASVKQNKVELLKKRTDIVRSAETVKP
jgi:anti-sigma factor RsiW